MFNGTNGGYSLADIAAATAGTGNGGFGGGWGDGGWWIIICLLALGGGGGSRGYSEPTYMNQYERDPREGKAPERRRMYMESKQMNSDKTMHMRELEEYAHDLTDDVLDMLKDASPEEKQTLKKKMIELTGKM